MDGPARGRVLDHREQYGRRGMDVWVQIIRARTVGRRDGPSIGPFHPRRLADTGLQCGLKTAIAIPVSCIEDLGCRGGDPCHSCVLNLWKIKHP